MIKSRIKSFMIMVVLLGCLYACNEGQRFMLDIEKTSPPGVPEVKGTLSMNGGVRFYYTIPPDEDVLAVKAEYDNEKGQTLIFSTSYFADSLDVVGFSDTTFYDVRLYAVNRAGQKSNVGIYPVKPKESALSLISKTLVVKPSFGSLYVEWENELKWSVNVYVNFKFRQNGVERDLMEVFTSHDETYRGIIFDLDNLDNSEVDVTIHMQDSFGNTSGDVSFGTKLLLQDTRLPKKDENGNMIWTMPEAGDSIAGIPQLFGNFAEGRNWKIIDDVLDSGDMLNFCHTSNVGRSFNIDEVDSLRNRWNVLIDLGGYWELSRCRTHQRMVNSTTPVYFGGQELTNIWNVGRYKMYVLNEYVDPPQWEYIREHRIPIPKGLPDLDVLRIASAGDLAYLYPDDPQFSRPTRWFRYEATGGFPDDYAYQSNGQHHVSEITLYGRPAQELPPHQYEFNLHSKK